MPSKTTLAVLILSFLVDTKPSILNLGLPLFNPINKRTQQEKNLRAPEPLVSDTKNTLTLPVKKQQNVKVFSILPEQNQDPNCKRPSRLERYSKNIYQKPAPVEKKVVPVPDVSVSSSSKKNPIPTPPVTKTPQPNLPTTKSPQTPITDHQNNPNEQQTNTSYASPQQTLTLQDILPKTTNLKQDPKQTVKNDVKITQNNNQKSTSQTQSQLKLVNASDNSSIDNSDTQSGTFTQDSTKNQQGIEIPDDGNNIIQGDDNQILGKQNLIHGNLNTLVGLNNVIRGQANKLAGKSNTIVGFENSAIGNQNGIIGVRNELMGNQNAVIGIKNTVQGNGNTLQTSKSIIKGSNNVIKTAKLL